jgi:hypothetical protein
MEAVFNLYFDCEGCGDWASHMCLMSCGQVQACLLDSQNCQTLGVPRLCQGLTSCSHIDPDAHQLGKRHTHKIECKHLTLRTQIKRLTHKTICLSKSMQRHDMVIGLFINRYKLGLRS